MPLLLELNECCKGLGVCWCILEISPNFGVTFNPLMEEYLEMSLNSYVLDCIGSQSTLVPSYAILKATTQLTYQAFHLRNK